MPKLPTEGGSLWKPRAPVLPQQGLNSANNLNELGRWEWSLAESSIAAYWHPEQRMQLSLDSWAWKLWDNGNISAYESGKQVNERGPAVFPRWPFKSQLFADWRTYSFHPSQEWCGMLSEIPKASPNTLCWVITTNRNKKGQALRPARNSLDQPDPPKH